ncbi:Isoleucyl-tRNA synthetase [Verrucomicrobium sp. GAS474]|uniref:isoleucine--tRNA ligase n=1 Tax=Verrucomicrobium sp. GAS474 TaxID=1882831 RepID=UPI00087BA1BE|nr:isoleucine--tRNA ligase [Verrucomicrobium sp. GAS474]SDU29977.1 Isoleucyl-tRNA synthetase [Verrucomicrobium sp. GAS474]
MSDTPATPPNYKETVLLPKTDFPMKADLPKREPGFLAKWKADDLYGRIQKKDAPKGKFILHDGPPFANGDAHMGHALNKTLKDIVIKYKTMAGFRVPYVPGWDCHGLPIEFKVMKELPPEKRDPVSIRQASEAYARKYIALQRGQFERLGILGDWENPYLTLNHGYEADILRTFATLVEKGLVYEGLRPVHWSTGCQTALAEAEIEYAPRTDPALMVKFPLTDEGKAKLGLSANKTASLVIWTTTPWTLPANLAVAASPTLAYEAHEVEGEIVIVAAALVAKVPRLAGTPLVKAFAKGSEIEGATYRHPFLDRVSAVHTGDFVTADAGTGLVHIAPGHGMDDYQLGQSKGLGILAPVDDRGCLTAEAGVAELTGVYVFKANPLIRDLLQASGHLWSEEEYTHDYPHCWRSKTPIVFRAVKQWFIKVDAFRQASLDALDHVEWIPGWGINRIKGAVASRADWCISRQRSWGVPIPVFYRDEKPILDAGLIRKFADIAEARGTNAWFETPAADLARELGLENPAELRQGTDTLDVWIDSGSSHAAVLKRRPELAFPADLYLEGSDQHRGWFQSSLLLSVATNGVPPYKRVLTNGFVVDVDGKKLSKSSGAKGMIDYVNEYGADILRLWVSSEDYRNDVPFSKEIFTRVADTYRTMRNTIRILLGNLAGFDPAQDAVADADLTEVDRYLLARLDEVIVKAREAYEAYEFHQVYHIVNRFCSVEVSAFYVDVLKDRMYCDGEKWASRRSSQTAMRRIVEALLKLLAPIVSYTAEEAWCFLGSSESIHLQPLPEAGTPADPAFVARWERILTLRTAVNESLEKARQAKTIGKSLEAEVALTAPDVAESDAELLKLVFIVSRLKLKTGGEVAAEVTRAEGEKCLRCWKYDETLGADPAHPALCARCAKAVS